MNIDSVILEGQVVRLEPLSITHLGAIVKAGSHDEIWTWMPVHPRNRKEFKNWIDYALAEQGAGTRLPFAIVDRSTGVVIGSTSFLAISRRDRRLEIGWTWLTPRVQRTAANTECKYLMLRHCFEMVRCLRVEFKTDARNSPSRKACFVLAPAKRVRFGSTNSRKMAFSVTRSSSASSTTTGPL